MHRTLLIFVMLLGYSTSPSLSQESDSAHILAGERMISATGLTRPFDLILPEASHALKDDISESNQGDSYRFDTIFDIVDEEALGLALRRGDLEKEALRIVLKNYETDELNEISDFFETPLGSRFFETLPYILPYSLDELTEISDFLVTSSGTKMTRSFPPLFRYTTSEIEQLREFMLSDSGKKFHEAMPKVFGELGQAGRIWTDGVRRDLARNVMSRANSLTPPEQLDDTATTSEQSEQDGGDQ